MYIVGLLYTYLAEGCGRKSSHGAFRALQRGYRFRSRGSLGNQLSISSVLPRSMQNGAIHEAWFIPCVYGAWERRVCNNQESNLQGKLFCQFCLPLIQELLSCRESVSCMLQFMNSYHSDTSLNR